MTQEPVILKQGCLVRIRCLEDDEWCEGIVALASSNGKSVAVTLDGMVRTSGGGIIAGVLPLIIDYETEKVTGLDGTEYEVEYH